MIKTSIITVANQKGGVGKTTDVVCLAHAFATKGLKVLVVDADFQANATQWFSLAEEAAETGKTLTTAIRKDLKFPAVLLKTSKPNIHVIASDSELGDAKKELNGTGRQFKILERILSCPELEQYNIVLIDTHPDIDPLFESAMAFSHYYIIPSFAEMHPYAGISVQTKHIERIKEDYNPNLTLLGIIINRFEKRNATHKAFEAKFRELSKSLKMPVFEVMIPHSSSVTRSASRASSIFDDSKNGALSQAFNELAGEILKGLEGGGKRLGRPQSPLIISPDVARVNLMPEKGRKGGRAKKSRVDDLIEKEY